MSFIGSFFGGYAAKKAGEFNQQLFNQQAAIERRNAEIKRQTFDNVELPRLLKAQERNKSTLFVNLLKSGVDVDRVGETPYLMLLEQNIEDAFDVSMARYNSRVTFENEINRSLLTQARGAAESYKGDLAFTTGILKGAGDIYANRDEYRSLLS
tara:strand:- start:655 stop:1116 length:462 start_codon:yes stop_codon:yes gene_type:complete